MPARRLRAADVDGNDVAHIQHALGGGGQTLERDGEDARIGLLELDPMRVHDPFQPLAHAGLHEMLLGAAVGIGHHRAAQSQLGDAIDGVARAFHRTRP